MEVDLIVLSYNFEDFIEESIASLLKLKLPFKTNLIITDDNSQDKTILKILKSQNLLESKFNKVIINVNKKNIGVKKNLEFAVNNLSKNQILILLSGDDMINADRVKDHVNIFLKKKEVLAISSNYLPVNRSSQILKNKIFSGKITFYKNIKDVFSVPFVGATTSYRKEVFNIFKYIDDDTTDVDIALKAYSLHCGLVCHIDKPHINYRIYKESLTLISPFEKSTLSEIKEKYKIWFTKKIKILKACNKKINNPDIEDLINQLNKGLIFCDRNIFKRIYITFRIKEFSLKKHLFPELRFIKQFLR